VVEPQPLAWAEGDSKEQAEEGEELGRAVLPAQGGLAAVDRQAAPTLNAGRRRPTRAPPISTPATAGDTTARNMDKCAALELKLMVGGMCTLICIPVDHTCSFVMNVCIVNMLLVACICIRLVHQQRAAIERHSQRVSVFFKVPLILVPLLSGMLRNPALHSPSLDESILAEVVAPNTPPYF
jgi:hypothetical protein